MSNQDSTSKFFIDHTKYNKLLDPNRETAKIKVEFLRDIPPFKVGDRRVITSEEYQMYSEKGYCKSAEEKYNPTVPSFDWFDDINNLECVEDKHREILKQYEGLNISKAQAGKHKMKWRDEPIQYKDSLFSAEVNLIGRKKDRLVLEFDEVKDEPENAKESFDKLKRILEHYGVGFIQTTHESKNSDYLWVEFDKELTEEEAKDFTAWISPEGSNIDLNFCFDKKVFPVMFAEHWKYPGVREMPIARFAGRKINFDALHLPKQKIEKTIRIGADGFRYETYQKARDVKEFLIIKVNEKTGKEKKTVDIDKVAEYIESKFYLRTIQGIKEETLEIYNEGIWEVKGKGIIKAEVERLLGVYAKINPVNEILEKIKRRTETSREIADDIPSFKRCLDNGVLDIEDVNNIRFIPHSKDYNFRNKFPAVYNISAKCPKFMEFVNQTFYPEDVAAFQEWLGFHLPRRYTFKKASIFHGPANTGKSVVLNFLTLFVGGNVSGLSLQEISRGKPFDMMALKNKDANIHDDLSSGDMNCVGGFKKAVGDGFIDGEQKFGDKFKFRNTAKDTNACNKIPSPGEDIDDEAYYERVLLFPIDNTVSKENMDRNLLDKLTTQEEMSGVLNWAIEGYRRLVKNNKFSNEKSPEETKFVMVQNGNSLAKFANEVLVNKDGSKIDKETMYQVYCHWCRNHKPQLSPDTKEKIGRNLTKVASYTQASSDGKKRMWLNVKLTDTYYTIQKNMSNNLGIEESNKNRRYKNLDSVISVKKPSQKKEEKKCPDCRAAMTELKKHWKCSKGCGGYIPK